MSNNSDKDLIFVSDEDVVFMSDMHGKDLFIVYENQVFVARILDGTLITHQVKDVVIGDAPGIA